MPENTAPILIASCGNVMAGDDAVGPRITAALRSRTPLPNTDIIDLDLRPAALLDFLPHRRALILVDAAHCPDQSPGSLIDFDWFDPHRPPLAHDDALSTHGLSIANQLDLASALNALPPHIRLIAIALQQATHGSPPSHAVQRAIPHAVNRVAHHIHQWNQRLCEPASHA